MKILTYLAIALLFLLGFSPYQTLLRNNLVADDASYLSHAFTLGLDFNLQYDDMIADWKSQTGIAAHPIGPGLLAAPFVSLFSLLDRSIPHPVIHHHRQYSGSWSLFGFVFATAFYYLWGILLYAKGLEAISLPIKRSALFFICASFGVLHCVLYRPLIGHAYEFFTLALCFWAISGWLKAIQHHRFNVIAIGLVALAMMLTLQVRPGNINVILLPVIVIGFYAATQKHWTVTPKEIALSFLIGCLYGLVIFVPFAYLNYQLYNVIFPSSDVMYGVGLNPVPHFNQAKDMVGLVHFLFSHSYQVFTILFTSEFGLVFSSAILFFGPLLLLVFLFTRMHHKIGAAFVTLYAVVCYVGLPLTMILLWQSPGFMYGYRFLFCLFPIAILGYAYWQHAGSMKKLSFIMHPLFAYGVVASIFWGLGDSLVHHQNRFRNAFGPQPEWIWSAMGYNKNVIHALWQPETWHNIIAKRAIGFLTGFGKDDPFFQRYQPASMQVYIQVIGLSIFFIGSGILFCRSDFVKRK